MSKISKPDVMIPLSCPHCAGPLSKNMEYVVHSTYLYTFFKFLVTYFIQLNGTEELRNTLDFRLGQVIELFLDLQETSRWTVAPLVRDSFSMIGSAVGGMASAFYGFNFVMPTVQKWVKGPMWLQFLIGGPPVILFSSACAGLTGGAVPALAQLASSSYHAAKSTPSMTPSQDDKKHQSTKSSTL